MRNGITTIRVPEGMELSAELLNSFNLRFPEGYRLAHYASRPDYHSSYARRALSIHNAFLFLLAAYPPSPSKTSLTIDTLLDYANECRGAWDKKFADFISKERNGTDNEKSTSIINDLQKALGQYAINLSSALRVTYYAESNTLFEAVALLNEAEQYDLMDKGRGHLATLTLVQTGGDTSYILQLDETLSPHYPQIINELEKIKALASPQTPLWFRTLTHAQQAYFCNVGATCSTGAAVREDINIFIKTWSSIKENAVNLNYDLQQIASNQSPLPLWWRDSRLKKHQKEMMGILATESPATISFKLNEFKQQFETDVILQEYQDTLTQVANIPQWYWVLPEHQQYFLGQVLKKYEHMEDAVSFLSSRHRTLPMPANFAAHSLWKISKEGEWLPLSASRVRSSHIASRDTKNFPKAVQDRHARSNLDAVLKQKEERAPVILCQTLISPVIPDSISFAPPDDLLYQTLKETVADRSAASMKIQLLNHPLNPARYILYTLSNDPNIAAFITRAETFAATIPGLRELITHFNNSLNSTIGSATWRDYRGRELFCSSWEQLITLAIKGYAYGSCVSGKDRKAIELIHTDAMILYYDQYGYWPVFEDDKEDSLDGIKKREDFINIFVGHYLSWHQHEHAGQNAPGSEAIKTVHLYLPKDIIIALNKRLGVTDHPYIDDKIASNNEMDVICNHATLPDKNHLLSYLITKQLGEEACTKLYDILVALINQQDLFTSKAGNLFTFFSGPSTGIEQIKKVMGNYLLQNNVARIKEILAIVATRPSNGGHARPEATSAVYSQLLELLKPPINGLAEVLDGVVEELNKLFVASKQLAP